VLYADTSVIVRAYLTDEPDHPVARRLVLATAEAVVTSELTRVEFAAAIRRAERAYRISAGHQFLRTFDRDCGPNSLVSLLPFERAPTLDDAYRLADVHGLKSIDALQLAVALATARGQGGSKAATPLRFATRDEDQAAAARAEGLTVV
jgi:predicted nucleic acid-binding protein